jgi:hypothetical protein
MPNGCPAVASMTASTAKVAGGGDTKLMHAYQAAAEEYFPGQDHHPTPPGRPRGPPCASSPLRCLHGEA